jgi:hypothetical protein
MKTAVRYLMWAHYIYLLLLPTLAVIAAGMMFPDSDFWLQLLIFGFPPVLMYSLFLANGYAIPNSLPVALIVVLSIPLQIGLSVLLFGSGSVWLFFAESAAVEIGAFVLGVLTIAMMRRRQDMSGVGFGCLLVVAFALFVLGTVPQIISVLYGYGGWSPWLILFSTAFATGYWHYAKVYDKLGTKYDRTGDAQNLEMKFDGGFVAKLLGLDTDVPLISPVWSESERKQVNGKVFLFGIGSMFLPVVAGIMMGVILNP